MTAFQIAALYVALHLFLNPVLMLRVGSVRIKENINLGDGGNPNLLTRIRAHGNFTETAPLALIGLIAIAMAGGSPLALHIFGAAFFFGRIAHAVGMNAPEAAGKGRAIGAFLSLIIFIAEGAYLLYLIFMQSAA